MQRLLLLFAVLFFQMATAQQPVFVKKWDNRFGGNDNEILLSFKGTFDKGFILGGTSPSNISGDKTEAPRGDYDYWVVKVDSQGNKQWDKTLGGFAVDEIHAMQATLDGGYILGGFTSSDIGADKTEPKRGQSDYWIIKIGSLGNKLWDRTYGGTLSENFWALIQTSDGGFLFGGYSDSGIGGDKTQDNWDTTYFYYDGWVIKTDSLGNKEWDKRFGGIKDDMTLSVCETDEEGYLIGCYSRSDMNGDKSQPAWGGGDFWVVKIDSSGNKEWDKRYGGTAYEELNTILNTKDGGYLIGGTSHSNFNGDISDPGILWMLKIDKEGNKIWDKGYTGGLGNFNSIVQTADSGFLIASRVYGGTRGPDITEPFTGENFWIVKTDSLGNKQWDKVIYEGIDGGYAIQTDDGCYAVAATVSDDAVGYISTPNYDPTNTSGDFWIMKFCWEIPINAPLLDSESGVSVYPNPFTSDLSIFLQKANLKEATFTITNIMGQVVFHKEENNLASTYTKMLDLSYLPNGVYLVEVVIDEERTVKKVVKE